MILGNRGEWSELYVFLRLLADGKLYAADENLNRIDSMFFPILKIIREETIGKTKEFLTGEVIRVCIDDECVVEVPVERFSEESEKLLRTIQASNTPTFSSEESEEFMKIISVERLEAQGSDKADVLIQIHDIQTGYEPEVGFSIKSKLGKPATLLNASKATNFVYEIVGPEPNISYIKANLTEIQGVEKPNANQKSIGIKEVILNVYSKGCYLKFYKSDERFADNLMMIDSQMSLILSEFILTYYRGTSRNTMVDILNAVTETNPLKLNADRASLYYGHKIKDLICSVALGMLPTVEWNGTDDATGGYIVVKNDGDIVAYHIYNRDKFKDYLLNSTRLEAPQRFDSPPPSKKKGFDFGYIYEESGKLFIKLNLQIRFR